MTTTPPLTPARTTVPSPAHRSAESTPATATRDERVASCFLLVARPRPACPPLRARLDEVAAAARAAVAATDRDQAVREAGSALSRAARIASECHQPDLARQISIRHIGLYTGLTRSLTVREAAQVIGPAANLARAHLGAAESLDQGVEMLTRVLRATRDRVTIRLEDDQLLPLGEVDSSAAEHRQLVHLALTQLLIGGTSALACGGRWVDAARLAHVYGGIGKRLLEGRQALIISRLQSGDLPGARLLVSQSDAVLDWECDAAACLTALCAPSNTRHEDTTAMIDRYQSQFRAQPLQDDERFHYRAQHGIAVATIAATCGHPTAREVAAQAAIGALDSLDGYAAREVLRHKVTAEAITSGDRGRLAGVVDRAGLTGNALTGRTLTRLTDAVDLAAHAIRPDL